MGLLSFDNFYFIFMAVMYIFNRCRVFIIISIGNNSAILRVLSARNNIILVGFDEKEAALPVRDIYNAI